MTPEPRQNFKLFKCSEQLPCKKVQEGWSRTRRKTPQRIETHLLFSRLSMCVCVCMRSHNYL
jgi:hypothetical protein